MKFEMAYTYSQLSSHSVGRLVSLHYDLPASLSCKYYVLGLHDNYLVENNNEKFILRIYRNDWRSREEIDFELELLAFLANKTSLVSFPLRSKTGELRFFIDSPEGKRAAALFNYASGYAPKNDLSIEQSVLLGNAVAKIHRLTETFSTPHTRSVLEIPYLLDVSIAAIAPFVTTEFQAYLKTLQKKLHKVLPQLSQEQGLYGICIGDVNPTNFHVNEKNQLTLFDFDQCGYGYRAFDIGKFISSIEAINQKRVIAKAFVDGYQQVRQLNQEEAVAIPCFEMVSVIWVMAIHVYNANRIGHKWLEKPFWDRRLAALKELDNEMFNKQN